MRQRREHGNVGAGHQRQMQRLHMRRLHHFGAARIDHDQLCALAQPLLQPRGEHRMGGGRIGADHHHDVGMFDRVEILRTGRGAESGRQAVAGRRMADTGAGVDIVVAETAADQLLHQIGFFIGAAGGGDAADRVAAILLLNALEFGGREIERFIPRHFTPGIVDVLADHRLKNALLVGGVAPREAAFDAGMPAIGLAVLVGNHAHDFLATHLRFERAADAAIGAGRDNRMLGLADLDDGLFRQRRGRAGLHASAAGDAFRAEETFAHAGRYPAVKTAARDRQREGALHFLAGAHAARADDAFRGVIGEVRVGLVLRHPVVVGATVRLGEHMVLTLITVAHVTQADRAGHVLQFAIAIGGAGQAVQRMVGDVQLHHALAQLLQPFSLGVHDKAVHRRRGAGGWRAGAALDLDQAEPAGAERVDHVGGAEFWNLRAGLHRRAHDGGALGHGDAVAVDGERHHRLGFRAGRAEVDLFDQGHCQSPIPRPAGWPVPGQNLPGSVSARS